MSAVTIKHARKSFREQQKALEEMFALFPNAIYEVACNSFNGRDYSSFKVSTKAKEFAPVATIYYLSIDELFDFGKPKIIGDSSWTWKSSFIEISCGWIKNYNFYTKDWQKNYYSIATSIRLQSEKECCGLKDWKKKYHYFLNLMNGNKDKELVDGYKKKINEANIMVQKWEEALKTLGTIQL